MRRLLAVIAEDVAGRDRSECWPWHTGKERPNDGRPDLAGKKIAHHALELDGRPRPAPPGDLALHSCDNGTCYNPDHLRWGTQQANIDDMVARERGFWQKKA